MRNQPEVWKQVPSVPGVSASSWGRVKLDSYTRRTSNGQVIVRPGKPRIGVKLKDKFQSGFFGKVYSVHRLVCEAFHGKPPFLDAVCMHLNENPFDNRPDNLAWGTQKQNLNAPGFIEKCRERCGEKSARAIWKKRRLSLRAVL